MFDGSELPLAGVDAAILAGGLGTRLQKAVRDVPKPMAPVLGRPFLFYQLDLLALRGARSVTLCCGHLANQIATAVGQSWLGMPINFSIETSPMGTGGALSLARSLLTSEEVLVMNGDSWLGADFRQIRKATICADICIAVTPVADCARYGSVQVVNNMVRGFSEKSQDSMAGLVNGGIYFMKQKALADLPSESFSLEKDFLASAAAQGRVSACQSAGPFLDIGLPTSYAGAGDFFKSLEIAPLAMFPDAPDLMCAQLKLGTCAVVFNEQHQVALEQRCDCGWWCLPGGRMEVGETVAQGAIREAREETGLEIEITNFLGVFSDPRRRTVRYPDNGDLRQLVDVVVLAKPTGGTLKPSEESLGVRWFDPWDVPLNTVPPVVEILRAAFSVAEPPALR